jgi:hypothetical protein
MTGISGWALHEAKMAAIAPSCLYSTLERKRDRDREREREMISYELS